MRVLVPLAEGFEEIEAVAIVDVLRRGDVQVQTVALGSETTVSGAHSIKIVADTTWDQIDPNTFSAIVLPGGGLGTENLGKDARLIKTIQEFNRQNKLIGAICAAPMVLAQAGVLEGREATCYPSCAEALGASYIDHAIVEDANIITGSGPGYAIFYAAVLLCHLKSDEKMVEVSHDLLLEVSPEE